MGSLTSAPGVLGAAETTYVTATDVMALLGCQKNTAYKAIREINKMVAKNGLFAYSAGKANKYFFAEKYGIPMDVVNVVIQKNKG